MRISDWSSDVCSSDLDWSEASVRTVWVRFAASMPVCAEAGAAMAARRRAAAKRFCMGSFRRSEEHTSELQSLMRISYAVFCLKKKKKTTTNNTADTNKLNKDHTTNARQINNKTRPTVEW